MVLEAQDFNVFEKINNIAWLFFYYWTCFISAMFIIANVVILQGHMKMEYNFLDNEIKHVIITLIGYSVMFLTGNNREK
jgi:hypothetical protein